MCINVFFWYRLTRVIPDKSPLNSHCCCCCCVTVSWSHSCCYLVNNIEYINHTQALACRSRTLKSAPSQVPPHDWFLGPQSPQPNQSLYQFVHFCRPHRRAQHSQTDHRILVRVVANNSGLKCFDAVVCTAGRASGL